MQSPDALVEAIVASPVGVALLAVLESRTHRDQGQSLSLETNPASVAAAVDSVHEMSFGALAEIAVFTAMIDVGPWIGDAPVTAAIAYQDATARHPIAEAIAERFGDELHTPLDHGAQQWWSDGEPWTETLAPMFRRFDDLYGAGEFTTAGMWTSTDPPAEAVEQMVATWELETGPVTRWWMPASPDARVFEIHRPEDWARLVASHPRRAQPHPGWELPGTNQRHSDIALLLNVPGQRAARETVSEHLVPDWESVAVEYDGIHLSWAGFITTEGYISDLDGGGVTMLRYWFSERTLWLREVFDQPSIAPDPHIDFAANRKPPFPQRIAVDGNLVRRLLGRS